jgi:hypothetical protein
MDQMNVYDYLKGMGLATGYIYLMLLINTKQYSTIINLEMMRTMTVGCF